jgi:hypothetical protein
LALLDLGPATGYQVGKQLGVARANAYAALDGLVGKGAARLQSPDPKVYRATRPDDLVAELGRVTIARVELLEQQFASKSPHGAASIQEFSGLREFRELAIRLAARDPEPVRFLGTPDTAATLTPVWRKREADGLSSFVIVTSDPGALPVTGTRILDGETGALWRAREPAVLSCGYAAIIGSESNDGPEGVWGSLPSLVGFARTTLETLTP